MEADEQEALDFERAEQVALALRDHISYYQRNWIERRLAHTALAGNELHHLHRTCTALGQVDQELMGVRLSQFAAALKLALNSAIAQVDPALVGTFRQGGKLVLSMIKQGIGGLGEYEGKVGARVSIAYEELAAVVQATPKDNRKRNARYTAAAIREVAWQLRNYTNTETILKKGLPGFKAELRARLEADERFTGPLRTALANDVEHFGQVLTRLLTVQRAVIKARENGEVDVQRRDPIEIDLTAHLEEAHKTLRAAAAGRLVPGEWPSVLWALTLVSGRRPQETLSQGQYAAAEDVPVPEFWRRFDPDHLLLFSGQLKTKSEARHQQQFVIPALCKADLVLGAIRWLERHNLRGEHMFETSRVYVRMNEFMDKRKFTCPLYHMRAWYLTASYANYLAAGGAPVSLLAFGQSVLGHETNDKSTIDSYHRYKLAPGSLTLITAAPSDSRKSQHGTRPAFHKG